MAKIKNVVLKPKVLKTIRKKLEDEWPNRIIFLLDNKGQPNNDGWRYIELWSRRKSVETEVFRCINCGVNHSQRTCPGCTMPATID